MKIHFKNYLKMQGIIWTFKQLFYSLKLELEVQTYLFSILFYSLFSGELARVWYVH